MPSSVAIVVAGEDLIARLRGGDPRALPRLATLIENENPAGLEALDALFPITGNAHVVGITGPPGAGRHAHCRPDRRDPGDGAAGRRDRR